MKKLANKSNVSLAKILVGMTLILFLLSITPIFVSANGIYAPEYVCEYCLLDSIFVECDSALCGNPTQPDAQMRVYTCYDCFNNSWIERVYVCAYDTECH